MLVRIYPHIEIDSLDQAATLITNIFGNRNVIGLHDNNTYKILSAQVLDNMIMLEMKCDLDLDPKKISIAFAIPGDTIMINPTIFSSARGEFTFRFRIIDRIDILTANLRAYFAGLPLVSQFHN